jgi:hypothetical protein
MRVLLQTSSPPQPLPGPPAYLFDPQNRPKFPIKTVQNMCFECKIKIFSKSSHEFVLKSNSSLTALGLYGNACCFISFSLGAASYIGDEGVIKLSEALKSNSSLTILNLGSKKPVVVTSFSLNVDNNFGNEGLIELSEALKSNSSLTHLDLSSNRLDASFHSRNAGNNIGNEGAVKLSEALTSNSSLTNLNLHRNCFTCCHAFLTPYS